MRIFPLGVWWDSLGSWRGVYAEPTIEWVEDYDGAKPPTVERVRAEIAEALGGKVFHGYKGGEFLFTRGDDLHVDNYGNYTPNQRIDRVEIDSCEVRIVVVYTGDES